MRAFSLKSQLWILMIVLVSLANIADAGIVGFGDFSNFTINKAIGDSGSSPNVVPGAPGTIEGRIELTDNQANENRTIFHNVPQSISKFTASFTYQEVNNGSSSPQSVVEGATFVLQNTPDGAHAVSVLGAAFGFQALGGFTKTAGISLELTNTTGTALYTNGSVSLGSANPTTPVNLVSGHPIDVSLSYNGTILSEKLTDTMTGAQQSFAYLVNLPSILGGNTAFVGFAAQTPSVSVPDQQYISNFQFSSVPEPSSFVLLSIGVLLPVYHVLRRRRN